MVTIESLVPSGHRCCGRSTKRVDFQFYSRAGEASLLRGQRPSGAGAGGVVQAVAAGLSVRSAFGAAAHQRGGERGSTAGSSASGSGTEGAGRLDAEPEPAPAFSAESTIYQEIFDQIVELGGQERAGLGRCSVHRFHTSEGEREQEQVRPCAGRGEAAGVSCGAGQAVAADRARQGAVER